VVRYVRTRDQFRQVAGVASAQSICVINGGYTYDTELLEKLARLRPDQPIERIDPSDLAQNFAELTLAEERESRALARLAEEALAPCRCGVEIKKFEPKQLPTLYTTNEEAQFLRTIEQTQEVADELWSEVLGNLSEDPLASASAQLCLNYANPLVRKIAQLSEPALARRAVEMLYVQSLLLGHYPLKAAEMKLLNEGLLGLIDLCVEARGSNSQV
jgi:molecular chaperone HtpG